MIDLLPERRDRVIEFLRRFDADGDHEFEPIHRTLAQRFKVNRAIGDVAQLTGAIGYLLTGERFERFDADLNEQCEGFERIGAAEALVEVERIFTAPDNESQSGLLFRHATAVLGVRPQKGGRHGGYIDYEAHHLTLLGGRELFLGIARAMVTPYREEESEHGPGSLTYREAVCFDLPGCIRPDVIAVAVEGRRHWRCWDDVVQLAESRAKRARRSPKKT